MPALLLECLLRANEGEPAQSFSCCTTGVDCFILARGLSTTRYIDYTVYIKVDFSGN